MNWVQRWIRQAVQRSPPPRTVTTEAVNTCFDEFHALVRDRGFVDRYGPSVLATAYLSLAEAVFLASIDVWDMTADEVTAAYEKMARKYRVRRRP